MNSSKISLKTKNTAFLLIHGFTGTHYEMVPLEEFLVSKGYYVNNITLPGHETTIEDLATTKWREWVKYAQNQLQDLRKDYENVFIGGLSMGGAITLYLGANNPDISGIIAMATPYKPVDWRMLLVRILPIHIFLKHRKSIETGWEDLDSLESHKSYGKYPLRSIAEIHKLLVRVKKLVPRISVPILVVQSKKDPSISSEFPSWIYDNVESSDKELVWIEKGGHVIPKDAGRLQLFGIIEKWLENKKLN
ncbi:MAG: alpha/beta fold hydrolase [Candidatus Heimdallarchaeota archaeon]|nr:alpha/beta fold hydrolase [Candidatus Heimdallarchaeota archaeon]